MIILKLVVVHGPDECGQKSESEHETHTDKKEDRTHADLCITDAKGMFALTPFW